MNDEKTLYSHCGYTNVSAWRQPNPCNACKRCHTTLTPEGVLSTRRLPHDYYEEEMVLSEDGKIIITVGVCKGCGKIDERLPQFTAIV